MPPTPSLRALAVVGLTLVLSAAAYLIVSERERHHADLDALRETSAAASTIAREVERSLDALHALHALYRSSREVEPGEFRTFAAVLLDRNPQIEALEWVPHVEAAERGDFERSEGAILEPGPDGGLVPVGDRAEYFPTLHAEPADRNAAIVGLDWAFAADRRGVLRSARDRGAPAASGPLRLVRMAGRGDGGVGVAWFVPIYRAGVPPDLEARRRDLRGFLVLVLSLERIVSSGLAEFDGRVSVEVRDVSEGAGAATLFLPSAPGLAGAAEGLREISVLDRRWRIAARPSPTGFAEIRATASRWILFAGLALAAGLGLGFELLDRALRSARREADRRAEAERSEREAARRLSHIVSALPTVVYSLRPAPGGFAPDWISDGIERLTGWTAIEALGDPGWWAARVHPDDRERAFAASAGVARADRVVHEYRFRCRDGTYRWIRDDLVLRRDERGDAIGVVGAWWDVTERKDDEAALAREEARFRRLVETANVAIVVLDRARRIVEWNPAAEEIYGRTRAEVVGRDYFETLVPEPTRAEVLRDLERVLAGESRRGFQNRIRRADGGVRHMIWNIDRLTAPDGAVEGVVAVGVDMTESKRLEGQLVQAQKMEAVGALAAGIGHEINNPLMYVLQNLELAGEEVRRSGPAEGRGSVEESLAEASEGVGRIQAIVRGLKTFSRLDPADLGPVDLRATAEATARMAEVQIRHRARLVRDLAQIPRVRGSDGRLAQVLLNLLVNAAQSIEPPDPVRNEVRIRTRAEKGWAIVEVSDTGCGIPPENLPRLFEPFFTTKPAGVGTGLGLSICRRIAEEHGGRLDVESAVGRGTTFTLRIPAAPGLAPDGSAPVPAAKSAAPCAGETGRRARVLVVDDEPAIRKALVRTLGRDHDVVAAGGLAEARAVLAENPDFDVVLADLTLGDGTGVDLQAEIERSYPRLADRTLFLTGGAVTAEARAFLEKFADRRLEKPAGARGILDAIARLLAR